MDRGAAIYGEEQGNILQDIRDLQDEIEKEENSPERDADKLNAMHMKLLMRGIMMQQFPFYGQFQY